MDYNYLAELLFPDITETPEELEAKYPPRDLPEGAKVTRMAPSPTGFMHLGNLFGAVTDERLAHQSGGVFYLRIEDTDQKREVEGGVETILSVFRQFGLHFDEGATIDGDSGAYGPYRQRQRERIYKVYAKHLMKNGMAYPCFCTEEELADMLARQEAAKENFGYYGKYAVHRDWELPEIEAALAAGKPYVVRFRSPGNPENHFKFTDMIKGTLELPENDQDVVILKSDGIPTYHFAHVVDDHLMRTTHVVRGEEWLATLPIHLQLFRALGWKPPKYCHTAQLMKMDGESKRKLSKRKDPELALDFYHAEGYPVPSVLEYLMTLLNSNFEEWRLANPTLPMTDFNFTTKKMSVSGSLFDIDKLRDVSKNVVAMMSAEAVYDALFAWARDYDKELYALLADRDYALSILSIGRGVAKPRKDIAVWSEMKHYMAFFYDELFVPADDYPSSMSKEDIAAVLAKYPALYDPADEQSVWFDKIRALAAELGYAAETREYKKNPGAYKGHVGDISAVLRMAVTGRTMSPDMHLVMRVLGSTRVLARLKDAAARL